MGRLAPASALIKTLVRFACKISGFQILSSTDNNNGELSAQDKEKRKMENHEALVKKAKELLEQLPPEVATELIESILQQRLDCA